jgi:hypothetical protein
MPKRNGYEIEPGARWLFVGSRREFPEGPEEVEVVDLQRGEVRVRFVGGRLEGKSEWHWPARLYAPVERVEEVLKQEEHYRRVRTRELPEVERRAVVLVGSTWSDGLLSGDYWAGSDPHRVTELLGVALEEVAGPGMGDPSQHEPGKWHLFGTHQRQLAHRLCQRHPGVVHDHATLDVARDLARLASRQNYRGQWYLDLPSDEDHPTVEFYRRPYLVICSWCRVAPDCDRLDVLEDQRREIKWLFGELLTALDRLGEQSPAARGAASRRLREHYRVTDKAPIDRWPGLPPFGKGDR